MKIKTLATATCIALLTACQPSIPEATDEQIVEIVGSSTETFGIKVIQKDAIECLRLISGLDDQIFKDAPTTFVAGIKTKCRKELGKRLKDDTRNPMGFELEHFENQDLVTRIELIQKDQQKQIEIRREEAEKAEAQEMVRKVEQAKVDAREHLTYVANWLTEMQVKCGELEQLNARRKEQGIELPWQFTINLGSNCKSYLFERVKEDAEENNTKIQELSYSEEDRHWLMIPEFNSSRKSNLQAELQELEDKISELKSYLDGSKEKS